MALLPSLSTEELHAYHQAVARSVMVRSHFDVYVWLQGDMQRYIPHDILIAAWGSFKHPEDLLQHDVLSGIPGVRSQHSTSQTLNPLLVKLFDQWTSFGQTPLRQMPGLNGFTLSPSKHDCALSNALQTMQSAIVHGIADQRGSHDCLYISFSRRPFFSDAECAAMSIALPYIDTALRQVKHLPHQTLTAGDASRSPRRTASEIYGLSERETEILRWVALGKTNPEIGCILDISEFTVKNHLQRIFKKLNVSNRAQAVSKLQTAPSHV